MNFLHSLFRQGVVAAVYPGATSAEVEEQVTKPLEKFLWGFKEIKCQRHIQKARTEFVMFLWN